MTRSKRKTCQRSLCILITVSLCVLSFFALAQEKETPSAGERDQTVRVHLSRLGVTDRMDLTLVSAYSASTQEGTALHFQAGSEIAILLRDDTLYLYYQGLSLRAGKRLTLSRDRAEGETGFRLTNYPALYMGDLRLDVIDGKVRPILSIHVEDYLLGVVPYEMSESFPLEALKAQAIAARTYALRKQNAANDFDLVDTTNDQVFRGYLPGNAQTEKAIRETRGICGFYNGKLAQCYYSASNGGQTELVTTVWPTTEDFGYYAFGDDPYDLANPASTVRTFELSKKYQKDETAPYALRALLASELAVELKALGYDPTPESVRVDAVKNVVLDTPAQEGSKRMTKVRMTVSISGRTRQDAPPSAADPDAEEVSLFVVTETPAPPTASPEATPAPQGSAVAFFPVVTVTPSPTPSPTPQPIYGPFTKIETPFALELDVFPTAESAFGLDISSHYDNEIWTLKETKEAYVIEARRYGHGVGMSQRGAQWMAVMHNMDYQQIMAFYYPGMELKRFEDTPIALAQPEEALAATAGPAPSPTPRPTLMPTTLPPEEGQWMASVTEIDDNSSLNLRSEPSLNGDIIMRLYKGQQLLVVEQCPEEGWVHVRTDVAEGYVMEDYLTKEGN